MATLGLLSGMITPACATNSDVESTLAGQGDLSSFYHAFMNTGVANELNENTEYTVFAPTNAAFAKIQPSAYPCFYSAQCRAEVAAVLRNHIVPKNESVYRFSRWGGDIPTIGDHTLYVEETYKDQYKVEDHTVLDQMAGSESLRTQGEKVSLYRIDGVIMGDKELARFRTRPVANSAGVVTEKTVTTYHRPAAPVAVSGGYPVPGGYPVAPAVYTAPGDFPDDTIETTTVTHTTTH
jgi:uncharacterized surface protein with fasciclin (FAS1) repeats